MDEKKKKISFIINPISGTQNKEQILKSIDEKLDKIAAIREKLSQVQSTVTCPNCGRECGPDDTFCSSCGAQL